MSLKVLGFTAAVCEITARVSVSTFRTALQQGQVISKLGIFFAIKANDKSKGKDQGHRLDRQQVALTEWGAIPSPRRILWRVSLSFAAQP